MRVSLASLLALSLPLVAADLPPDVAALKAKRDAKIAEVNQTYANELEKLQKLALKNGNLEAANAIEAEIAAAVPNPFSSTAEVLSHLVGKWMRKTDGTIFQINSTSSGIHNGSTAFSINYDPKKKTVTLNSRKWVDTLSFTSNPDELKGVDGNGKTYKLTRIASAE